MANEKPADRSTICRLLWSGTATRPLPGLKNILSKGQKHFLQPSMKPGDPGMCRVFLSSRDPRCRADFGAQGEYKGGTPFSRGDHGASLETLLHSEDHHCISGQFADKDQGCKSCKSDPEQSAHQAEGITYDGDPGEEEGEGAVFGVD